jgi:hypothetical protein
VVAIDALNLARRALPDYLSCFTDAKGIIDRTPGLADAIRRASSDPLFGCARRPVGAIESYQVVDDPDARIYPDGEYGVAARMMGHSQVKLTESEASIVNELGLREKLRFNDIRNEALAAARVAFASPDGNDDHRDAFRHAYWSARLTQEFGFDFAERYTTAHEARPDNPTSREAMDLHNNSVGRSIALSHPEADSQELARYVGEAVRRGDTVVIGRDGQLVYSDQILPADTIDTNELDQQHPRPPAKADPSPATPSQ